ncbi:hypothetical protein [Chryseobacterium salivictor]|uniref:CD-NTase associated protein 4-like DNA endonuclease domain-containing protein n=1 Tax=Chryseobacterium salivictor TaxID=2547600 RepID=A0A4V1ALF9_9FLAO|nr:hypothetical protein [Chryseobacterium salivictor]QBO59624.1 hypothetical protein NBC122_02823 [Chryseobacterium salivictor]
MAKGKIDTNSGVQASVGFDFQRNTCIYVFLDNYIGWKNQEYFIMLEHYDDIVFGFLNTNGELSQVTTYQAKKSSTVWTTNKVYEIIQKISNSGIEMFKDNISKSGNYKQSQHFISNNTIALDYKCSTEKKTKKVYVNETNESVTYTSLDVDCQNSLKKGNSDIKFDSEQIEHFKNLNFTYIDLGRNTKSQLELLRGKFETVFGKSIIDHTAARDTLIFHLKEIESTYNQGDIPKFSDKHKRLESAKIDIILNILTTKNLALDFCRKKAEKICEELSINVFDAMSFELDFENSLDEFKDLKQGEHQKIIRFIESKKSIFWNFTNDVLCIKELYGLFLKEQNSTLNSLQLKASMAAAYFLILNQK